MLKMLLAGLWGVAMVLGGIYLHGMMQNKEAAAAQAGGAPLVEQVVTELTGVPVIIDGQVKGYLVFRLHSTVDRNKLPSEKFSVAPYLVDAAFRAAYDFAARGVLKVRRQDVEDMTAGVAALVDAKLGPGVVQAVNFEQFNYVRSDEVRGNLFEVQ